jgi:hypothetical protein
MERAVEFYGADDSTLRNLNEPASQGQVNMWFAYTRGFHNMADYKEVVSDG